MPKMNQNELRSLLSTMPPLAHKLPGMDYDENRSEVVAWLLAQPGVKDWLFQRAASTERIEYDTASGKWHGVTKGPRGRPVVARVRCEEEAP